MRKTGCFNGFLTTKHIWKNFQKKFSSEQRIKLISSMQLCLRLYMFIATLYSSIFFLSVRVNLKFIFWFLPLHCRSESKISHFNGFISLKNNFSLSCLPCFWVNLYSLYKNAKSMFYAFYEIEYIYIENVNIKIA